MLNLNGTQPIHTEHLVLRRFVYSDNGAMLKYWASDPLVQKMYSEPVYSNEQEVRGLLDKYIAGYEDQSYFRWAISLPQTDECVGQIAYFMVNTTNHFAELEYCIGRRFQCQGLMTEAVHAVMKHGFEEINLHKIQVCHKANNQASRRVIEKCGFVYEGTLRDYFFMDGVYVDRLYYSMLQNEWPVADAAALSARTGAAKPGPKLHRS